MSDLREFWNKNTARIPDDKGCSLYAIEKERYFPRNSVVCDLGGGTGADSLYFISKGHQVLLVDIADSALTKAKVKVPGIKTVQCDFSFGRLPLDNESCNVVYSRLALHYFESQVLGRLFMEIYRILRPGGCSFISLKSPDDAAEMAFLATTAIQQEKGVFNEQGRIKTRYTTKQLKEILARGGIPSDKYHVVKYKEKLKNTNDVIKSGNKEFIVNEVTIQK